MAKFIEVTLKGSGKKQIINADNCCFNELSDGTTKVNRGMCLYEIREKYKDIKKILEVAND